MLGSWNGKDKTKDQMYIQDKLNSLVDGKPDELMHAEQLHASASLQAAKLLLWKHLIFGFLVRC